MCSPTKHHSSPSKDGQFSPDVHPAKRFFKKHAFASLCSILFVILALLLPLHHASQAGELVDTSATILSTDVPSSRPTPKRGKQIGNTFDARHLYQAYKEVETEYHTKAFRDTSEWRVLASRDDVEVSIMEHESDPHCPYVKMVAVIPASIQECWNWLSLSNWPENMPKMDPFYEGVELHGNFDYRGVNMILARKRTKRIWAFGKRDMVFLSVSDEPLPDGTWISGSVSVETPRIPRKKDYTRAFQDSIAFYKPVEGNTKTELTIVCRIDLNDSSAEGSTGWIPMWLYVKTVGVTGLRSVSSMRDVIMTEKQEARIVVIRDSDQKKRRKGFSLLGFRKHHDLRMPGQDGYPDDIHSQPNPLRHFLPWRWGKEAEKPDVSTTLQTSNDNMLPTQGKHRVPRLFFKQ